ncbi:methyltransferase domain-containing protein [Lacibacter sp. MH-610]|uniref:class I SAM-dependent methyltransferase n=1 Tax=Lacibacter sp. MH-610 TaxID=3020883 RepID=UPI003892A92F
MKKLKWIFIWSGLQLLKRGMHYRISGDQERWLKPFPSAGLVNRKQFITDYCRNKSVLHIGFADAPFTTERIHQQALLHSQLKEIASSLYGLDTNEEAVNQYRALTGDENVSIVPLREWKQEQTSLYALVLVGEVLEHIASPSEFITECAAVLKPGQELLITVPNYTSLDSMAASLHATESIHEDHHWYFSPYTLLRKFEQSAWQLKQFAFGVYGNKQPNFIQRQFPATGDCIIAVFKRK